MAQKIYKKDKDGVMYIDRIKESKTHKALRKYMNNTVSLNQTMENILKLEYITYTPTRPIINKQVNKKS